MSGFLAFIFFLASAASQAGMAAERLQSGGQGIASVDPYAQTAGMHRGMNVLGADPIWDDPAKGRFKPRYFTALREAGFDTVRLVTSPFAHMDAEDRIAPAWLATLDQMVASALANDLTPIIDLHDTRECESDLPACERKVLAFWRQVAPRYQHAPVSVLFEILNEPHAVLTAPAWNTLLHQALALIRQSNPTRNVIVGPAGWSSVEQLPTLELPAEDRHIIVTVHYYSPMTFTHQGAPWVKETKDLSGVTYGTPADWRKVMADFDMVKNWSDRHHRPIFLGEFGAYEKGDLVSRMHYDNYVARAAELHGFPWAYWQFDSDFIVYDVDHDRWVKPILLALIPPGEDRGSPAQ
jgi:endoglucanase